MESFKVIVAGSRTFRDYDTLKKSLDILLSKRPNAIIISGGAAGADSLGERYAQERGLEISRMPADWAKHGRAAGMIRNREMAEIANALVAFSVNHSRGTENMIEEAKKRNLLVRVYRFLV